MSILISKSTAATACGYSEVHIMRLAKKGSFPTPVRLGNSPQHAVRFVKSEVDAWIDDRVAVRDASFQRSGGTN